MSAVEAFQADLSDPRHGTNNGYCNLRCRCTKCAAAGAELNRYYKRRRLESPLPEHVHGTQNGYDNYNCRCEECRQAAAAARSSGFVPLYRKPEIVARTLAQFDAGVSVDCMAADISASRQLVYKILEDNGRSLKARRLSSVVGMYFTYCQGASLLEVAEANGLSVETMRETFHTYRLPLRKRTRKVRVPSGRRAGDMRVLIERNRERSAKAAGVNVRRSIAALEYAKQNPPRTRVKTEAWLRQIEALNARIENPTASLKEIAMKLGMTKDAYSRLLARGWSYAEASLATEVGVNADAAEAS